MLNTRPVRWIKRPRPGDLHGVSRHRRLRCETLECRQLLSVSPTTGEMAVLTSAAYAEPIQASVTSELPDAGVLAIETTTSLETASTSTIYGEAVTLTATVVFEGAEVLTGTVDFMDGAELLDTIELDENGMAEFAINSLDVGIHSITAIYSGDDNFETSTSSAVEINVDQATTALTLEPSTLTPVYGEQVTFVVTINSDSPTKTPSGSVRLMEGATELAIDNVGEGGVVEFVVTLPLGVHSITATYNGNDNFAGGESLETSLTVDPADTTSSLSLSTESAVVGQEIVLTATVAIAAPGSGTPTGTVSFMDSDTTLGTDDLTDGTATLSISSLEVGTYTLTVVYSGDSNFNGSTSEEEQLMVIEIDEDDTPPMITITGPSLTNNPQPTATISVSDSGSGAPNGTEVHLDVDLNEDGNFDGEEIDYATVSLNNGTATFQPSSPLEDGTYPIRARASDVAGNEGTSAVATVTVDTTAPTVTINQASGQADPTQASPISFTVVFSEEVTDFATGDITLDGTAGATTATITGSGTTYTVTVSGMNVSGTVIATIAAGAAHDAAGNANLASESTDNQIQFDLIVNQSFVLTGPVNNTYQSGDNLSIEWTATIVEPGSKISLCLDEDTTWDNNNEHWIKIDQITAANGIGTLVWNTTAIAPGTYFVAGYLWNGDNTFTLSHLTESISITGNWTPQSFALSAPISESYDSGDIATIEWTAAGVVPGSKISLCLDEDTIWDNNNEHWIKIDQITAANGEGSLDWNTANIEPGTYYVAGYMWDGGTTFTLSHLSAPITISGTWTPPGFSLTGPNAGSYEVGDDVSITWTATDIVPGSKISLCYDEDANWDNGDEHWIEVDQVTATDGTGSYTWTTAGVEAGTYYMAGYLWDGGTGFTLSHLDSPITITVAQSLTIGAGLSPNTVGGVLGDAELAPIIAEANRRWIAALGDEVGSALQRVTIEIANLPGGLLGQAVGTHVTIDDNGADFGWYVDPTPGDDSEFASLPFLDANATITGANRADLLTAVMHELGHVLGYADNDLGDLMDGLLPLDTRRTTLHDQVLAAI